ncbi:MAG: 6-phosphogluconolactonase [Aurantibacter sp.]
MKVEISETKQQVAQNFSRYLADFIASKNESHVALSGGSTPKIVFDQLARNYANKIDWGKAHLYWGDERCVPPTDADSNYKMTVDHLLSKINIPKANVHRIKGENNPEYEAERYSKLLGKELPKKNKIPSFDLVILGMGDDGHTASIFPHEIGLWDSKDYCEIAEHPQSGQQRVTITGQIINNATEVVLLVTGLSKAEKVREIINREGDYKDYPASLVAPRSENLVWFLDGTAADGIT